MAAQHRVGRDGKYHAGDARHAAGKQQDNENFQRMGMDAITVYKRLEQGIVYQAGNEHGYRHAYQERQNLGVEVHVKIEDNAHGQTKQDADEGTNVRNNIQAMTTALLKSRPTMESPSVLSAMTPMISRSRPTK